MFFYAQRQFRFWINPCVIEVASVCRYTGEIPDTRYPTQITFSFTWCSLRRIRVDRCCTFFIRSSGSRPVRVTKQDLARVPCQQLTFAINWYSTRPQRIPTMSLIIHLLPHAVVMDFRTLLCRRRPTLLVRSRFYPLVHLLLDLLLDSQEAQLSAGKCASNVAILYGADGISIWNRISMASRMWQTDSVRRFSGAICRINTKRQVRHAGKVA